MNRSPNLTVSILTILLLLLPLSAMGQDLTLTKEGKIPGRPFEALQEQIDDLQQQILDLQLECVSPAYSTESNSVLMTEIPTIVMSKSLPPGEYVSNISMGFQYPVSYGVVPDCWAFVECSLTDSDGNILASGVGGNVVGITNISGTNIIGLTAEPQTTVVLSCFLGCEWCPGYIPNSQYPDPTLMMGGADWTFIKVDRH